MDSKYFIYTSILDQVLVFEKSINDMRPTGTDMVKLISQASLKSEKSPSASKNAGTGKESPKASGGRQQNVAQFEKYKQEILQKSREMMPHSD